MVWKGGKGPQDRRTERRDRKMGGSYPGVQNGGNALSINGRFVRIGGAERKGVSHIINTVDRRDRDFFEKKGKTDPFRFGIWGM